MAGKVKLTAEQRVVAIRRYLAGEHQTEIARSLGVNQATISRTVKAARASWEREFAGSYQGCLAELLARLREGERLAHQSGNLELVERFLRTAIQAIVGRMPQKVELTGSVPWEQIAQGTERKAEPDDGGLAQRLRGNGMETNGRDS